MKYSTIKIYKAIDNAQRSLLSNNDHDDVFISLLRDILEITNSPIGFFGEVLYNKDSPYIKMRAISNIHKSNSDKKFVSGVEFHNLDSYILKPVISGETIVINDKDFLRHPRDHLVVDCYIGIPVKIDRNIVGLIGLANSVVGYGLSNELDLTPLVKTIAAMIERKSLLEKQEQYNRVIIESTKYDKLTSLPSRWLFENIVYDFESKNNSDPFLIASLNVDSFRKINERHGFHYGDFFIKKISEIITSKLPPDGICCRDQGDEFLLLTNLKSIDDIKNGFDVDISTHGRHVRVNVSIGIAYLDESINNKNEVVINSKHAMYAAKKSGGNQVVEYSQKIIDESLIVRDKILFVSDAIEKNKIVFFLQPQINMIDNSIFGYEFLIRIREDEMFVMPDEFLPFVSETDMDVILGDYIIDTTISIAEKLFSQGVNCNFSINISAYHLLHDSFFGTIYKLREKFNPELFNNLRFEITETSLINDLMKAEAIILYCNDIGINFSIDDFGTGYSSINYFRSLPIDEIKLDKSFIEDIEDRDNMMLIGHIINMANSFNKIVIAEGIENEKQKTALLAIGCKYGQGYHYSKPIPWEWLLHNMP